MQCQIQRHVRGPRAVIEQPFGAIRVSCACWLLSVYGFPCHSLRRRFALRRENCDACLGGDSLYL